MSDPIISIADARRVLLVGTARALNLLERMPVRFRKRGWDLDDRVHIAISAVCCVRLRCALTVFTVFPGANDSPEWASITGKTTAAKIVEALELSDMLEQEKIKAVGG